MIQCIRNTKPLLVFLCQALTGIFQPWLPQELFEAVHPTVGYVLSGLVALHLTLNWNWVMGTLLRRRDALQKA